MTNTNDELNQTQTRPKNFDKNFSSRQFTMDLYDCKQSLFASSQSLDDWEKNLQKILSEANITVLSTTSQDLQENKDRQSLLFLLDNGHFAIHIYHQLHYVAADLFLCEEHAKPEMILQGLRNLFKPVKVRTTYLKRGDLRNKNIRPKIKTRTAPLRRIRNTGMTVMRLLSLKK